MHSDREWIVRLDTNNILHYKLEENTDITITMFSYSTMIFKISVYRDADNNTANCYIRLFEPYNYIRLFLTKYYRKEWKKCCLTISTVTCRGINLALNNKWIKQAFDYESAYISNLYRDLTNYDQLKYRLERRINYTTRANFDIDKKEFYTKKED